MHDEPNNNSSTQQGDANAFREALGKVIAVRDSNSGMSQRAFARRADIDITHLREIENGKRNITLQTLIKLAFALGTLPSELLDEAESRLGWK